jgi:chromosome segregation ATPase
MKQTVEDKIKELTEESEKLMRRRAEIENEQHLISQRLSEIQGGINVLIPLYQELEANEKKPTKRKTKTRPPKA